MDEERMTIGMWLHLTMIILIVLFWPITLIDTRYPTTYILPIVYPVVVIIIFYYIFTTKKAKLRLDVMGQTIEERITKFFAYIGNLIGKTIEYSLGGVFLLIAFALMFGPLIVELIIYPITTLIAIITMGIVSILVHQILTERK